MTPHDHREFVPGCFRCQLSRDEVDDTIDMEHLAAEMLTALQPYWHAQDSMTAPAAITRALGELDVYRQALEDTVAAIEQHQRTLDHAALGASTPDRDDVDNALYNATIGPGGVARVRNQKENADVDAS